MFELKSRFSFWLMFPNANEWNRINQLVAIAATDVNYVAAALSEAAGDGPPTYEAVVLTSVANAKDASCPVEVLYVGSFV